MSESELLQRLRQGDQDAFDLIFRAHYASLVGFAAAMLHDRALAEDLVQDVMLEVWRRRETLAVDTSLRAYLIRATRNRALNHIRHQRVAERAAPLLAERPDEPATADAAASEQEIDRALRAAVATLPERCREVFELSRVRGLRYSEIASALDISVKTVEAQMGKALRILRDRLEAFLPSADV